MLYPVYVHQDEGTALGLIFPDFPGCFSAADSIAKLPQVAQEAVEVHMEGEDLPIPEPTDVASLAEDPDYQGGSWVWVDINVNRLNTARERINVSVPKFALVEIDEYAQAVGLNRSEFLYSAALDVIRDVQGGTFARLKSTKGKFSKQFEKARAEAPKKRAAAKKKAAKKSPAKKAPAKKAGRKLRLKDRTEYS